jgi:uncharacterized protein
MALKLKKTEYKNLAPFYFKYFKNKYLVTNEIGEWLFLTAKEFDKFLSGDFKEDFDFYLKLKEKNLIKKEINIEKMCQAYRSKRQYLFNGPSLHIVIPTLRCDHQCLYCQASAKGVNEKEFDMPEKTAKKVVDKIFQSTSESIVIEFQGGEPLLNWPIVKFIIEYAKKKNKKIKKEIELRLVSNFSLMDEEKFKFLLENKVNLCTSIDGPEKLHNSQRILLGGNSYRNSVKWIKKFNKIYPELKKKNYIHKIDGLTTITRFSLAYPKKIVDEYLKLGFSGIYLRPLSPFGFSQKILRKIGYSAEEFTSFYKKAFDYIIKLNLQGKRIKENMAKTFLVKILTESDPNHMDFRSPCGAGIGQLAYNFDGNIYTCDEGRMMAMMGDENFKVGNVFENSYKEIVSSPAVRTICLASCLDNLSGCATCVYKPYCGVCPIYNYFVQGNIFTNNDKCKINQAILDLIFEKLENKKIREIFESWLVR